MAKHDYVSGELAGRRAVEEAARIAASALALGRGYHKSERRRVEALLFDAETALGVVDIPRDPAELVEFTRRRAATQRKADANG